MTTFPCANCGTPRAHIGVVGTDYDGNDPRLVGFIERVIDRIPQGEWDIYECRNEACGCACRRYQFRSP